MIEDFEHAAAEEIKEKKREIGDLLNRFEVTDKQAIDAFFKFANKKGEFNDFAKIGFCCLSISHAIKGLESKKYKHFFTGITIVSGMIMAVSNNGSVKEFLSDFGRSNALKRHAETYQLKREVFEYWSESIDSTLSNEKAAELLKKHFPLSHRKLSEYVAEAKRMKTDASKGADHARK